MKNIFKYFLLPTFFLIESVSAQLPLSVTHEKLTINQKNATLPPSNSVSHISIDNGKIYIGTGNGLALSTDTGSSWTYFRDDPAFKSGGIYAIASHNETVWVSTGYNKETNSGSVQTGSGYAFRIHPDSSWNFVPQTLDLPGDSIISYGINDSIQILPVTVPEQNITFDIAISNGAVWIASWASGLRKTTDNGVSWKRILLPHDYMNTISPDDTLWSYASTDSLKLKRIFKRWDPRDHLNLLAFSVHISGEDTIWCGTAGGINKSTDGGLSWTKFNHQNQASPILGNWVITIREQNFNNLHRIWTTNWKTDNNDDYGVSYTDDGGKSWTNILHGIKAYDFAFKDSITYIATNEGFYRTTDGGQTFTVFTNSATAFNQERNVINTITLYDPTTHQSITTTEFFSAGVLGNKIITGSADGMAIAEETAGQDFGIKWKILRTYEVIGTTRRTYAYPNPFSPKYELTRIHYGSSDNPIGNGIRQVTIDIFDFGMNRIRTLIKDAERDASLEYDELWDGRDDNGKIVANGVYFYRVVFNDDEPMMGKILVLQ